MATGTRCRILYEDESWRSPFRAMHPAWLLAYSVKIESLSQRPSMICCADLASSLSIYGCYQYWNEVGDNNINHVDLDIEQGTLEDPLIEDGLASQRMPMNPRNHGKVHVQRTAGSVGLMDSDSFPVLSVNCTSENPATIRDFIEKGNAALVSVGIVRDAVVGIELVLELFSIRDALEVDDKNLDALGMLGDLGAKKR
ncbi:hypothetical protein CTI12_AA375180 [Artemisia annua]|uniref:Uncharacterized protein n=1 Tax=Artemisia annua TaxID=35608 RepID=A0A2U1MIT0_ARTAN|nr:hypothetical protein CTI12_AA375180 [Artemisia annua]